MRESRTSVGVVLLVVWILVWSPLRHTAADEGRAAPAPVAMSDVIQRYEADQGALERYYDVRTSEARRNRLREFDQAELQSLRNLDFDAFDQANRIDYLLLQSKLKFDVKQLDARQTKVEEVASLLPFAPQITALEESRQRMEKLDPQQAAKILSEVETEISKVRRGLEEKLKAKGSAGTSLPNPILARRAAGIVDGLRRTLAHWNAFYEGYDPEFSWWMREPFPKVDKALKDYAGFLRTKMAGFAEGQDEPVIGDPIGRQALLDALAAEMIPYTPEELIDIANREFEWCEVEMKRATRDLGCDDWHQALAKVTAMHVKPGEQPQLIKQLAEEATKFVEDRNLVTIPPLCKESWRMEMMPVERQKLNPYFTGGEEIRVSYPTDTMSYEDKIMSMQGNCIPFCRATVFHEVIPGHHLQIYMAQRYRPYRETFRTPFLIEGWALYWEMRFWDLDFPRTPAERVGMLFWRAHRCARIIFSLKFHLGQMSAQEAIDFLVNRVGHERRNATAEVRRSVSGEYGPLYQAAYMLGALQLRAMHKELVQSGKMTDRQFNDAVLRESAIPVAMIRASLTGQKLTRDFVSDWRFYDEISSSNQGQTREEGTK